MARRKGVFVCYECLARKHGFENAHDFLDDLYWGNPMMTANEVALKLGRSTTSIMNALHFYAVKVRSKGESSKRLRLRVKATHERRVDL